ncbi:hypothetical protein HELRODRAFT_158577 [Helobdella robusta]|uniref:Uncharacterized protein n=1 Tax=Helobdella robusta TaxID=6412 RepID=T1EMY7_HELRO|nr:hypothetical protein HELRODRAFT_158577 [Helobdella robusta]ESO12132.1 hypothetical protein HELRODRAFT_158577 [Helobdella robusta]
MGDFNPHIDWNHRESKKLADELFLDGLHKRKLPYSACDEANKGRKYIRFNNINRREHNKRKKKLRLNTPRMYNHVLRMALEHKLNEALKSHSFTDVKESWQFMRDLIYQVSLSVLGEKAMKNENWCKANLSEIEIAKKKEKL